jgi:formylglycine-generating enzyme required for sulfatase activity
MTRRTLLAFGTIVLTLAAVGLACTFGPSDDTTTPAATSPTEEKAGTVGTPQLPTPLPTYVQEESANAVQAAIYALAVYLGRDPGSFTLVSAYESQFPDTALGCPRPGETPEPVTTSGYTVILADAEREFEVHTSPDGLRVRCLSDDLRPSGSPGNTGIIATLTALENREYGTLASLLPATVGVATYPGAEQPLASSSFVAQLRDIWLGPADVKIDLNTNVLALMPSLQLPASQIPVYSTGWTVTRDTDGILFFDLGGAAPILTRVLFVPADQKAAAYQTPPTEEGEDEQAATAGPTFRGPGFTIPLPSEWTTSSVASQVNLHPPGEGAAITVGPWIVSNEPRDGQTFRSWLETSLPEVIAGYESINSLEPIWAASGQPGYLVTWNSRRSDGALERSNPIALFQTRYALGETESYALAVTLLNADFQAQFQEILDNLVIDQLVGVPADMNIYRHDDLGYRIQYPADWKLLTSPFGAAFQPPDGDVAISIGPWPLITGPAPGQSFENWVATAPSEGIQGYGPVQQISPVQTANGDLGYLATWQIFMPGGGIETSDPAAVFPFHRQWSETTYHALAISLHVPTETQTFDRMIATLVIETMDTAEMVYIPAGPFVRGSNDQQIGAWTSACGAACRAGQFLDEAPQRMITLRGYFIDRTEVTVAQFKQFVEATGYQTTAEQKGDPVQYTWRAFDSPDRQNHPVRWMTWHDANAYCQWAGKRLPTEAEWEKAARGEDGRTWPWGNDWDDSRVPHGDTVPVDSYENGASPYGALGMAGNVWEWVADWYDASYYSYSPDSDPPGPAESPDKVLRGGGFNNANWALRAAHRHFGGATGYATDHGFRCAADG